MSSLDFALSCVRLFCNTMNYSLSGSSVHGILQARMLEWVAMPSSRGSSRPGIEPASVYWQAVSLPLEPPEKAEKILREGFLMGSLSKVSELQSQLEMFVLKTKFKIMCWVGQRVHWVFLNSLWKTWNKHFGQCDRKKHSMLRKI